MNDEILKSFEGTRKAGAIAAGALDELNSIIKPGVTTEVIDKICYEYINDNGAYSAPLFYRGFPKSCCTSTNHIVCHGIPQNKFLRDGDIINVDVTAIKDGWHGDTSRMFLVGNVSVKAKKLIKATYESMIKGIETLKEGSFTGDIGSAIQNHVEQEGFSVVRDFCGHGLGKKFHEPPNILHYGEPKTGKRLSAGMLFTIEPMINEGEYNTKLLQDGWTAVTKDKSLSAQFEHTVGVTSNGYEIFTLSKKKLDLPESIKMIERYSREEVKKIWQDHNRYKIWLDIELAAALAMEKYKLIPKGVYKKVKSKSKIDVKKILKIEGKVRHDVIAFLSSIMERSGKEGRFLHKGMTSSDVLDTCFNLQLKQSGEILLKDIDNLLSAIKKQSIKHKFTLCIGRSHGIHAEPTTFGLKLLTYYAEFSEK